MILYENKYIRVKDSSLQTNGYGILQLDSPQIIGIINSFPNTLNGERNRVEYLSTANLDVTGKAEGHRIFCHPYGSTQKLGNEMTADEVRQIMTEMANHYMDGLPESMLKTLVDKKNY